MTVVDITTSTTWTVPAGVTSARLEAWGAFGGADGYYYNGGYGAGDYACTPDEILTIVVVQNQGANAANTYISAPGKNTLVSGSSGWDDGYEGDMGYGYCSSQSWMSNRSSTNGTNTGLAKVRITYTAGGGGTTPVTATRATTWNINSVISSTRSTTWNVLTLDAQVSASRVATWNINTTISKTISTTWDILSSTNPVTSSRSTTWDIAAPAGTTIEYWEQPTYGTFTWTVPLDVTSVKLEITGAYGGSEYPYMNNGGYASGVYACTPGEVLSWTLGVESSWDSGYTSQVTAPSKGQLISATGGWDDGNDGAPGQGITTIYVTQPAATIGQNTGTSWGRVTYATDTPLASVTSSRTATWDTTVTVVASRVATWDVLETILSVTESRTTTWDIFITGVPVTSSVSTTWDIATPVPMTTVNFIYPTDASTEWIVPAGVHALVLHIEGGDSTFYDAGGTATGHYACTPGEVLTIHCSDISDLQDRQSTISTLDKGVLISASSGWALNDYDYSNGYGNLSMYITDGATSGGGSTTSTYGNGYISYFVDQVGPVYFIGWGLSI